MGICSSERFKGPKLEREGGTYDVLSRERAGSLHSDPESSHAPQNPQKEEKEAPAVKGTKSVSVPGEKKDAKSVSTGTKGKTWNFSIGWCQHKYYELRGSISRETRESRESPPTRDRQGASERQRILVRSSSAPPKQELPRVP